MDILATVSIETGTVIITTLVAAIIAPFARRLGHKIFFRVIKRKRAPGSLANRSIVRADHPGEGV